LEPDVGVFHVAGLVAVAGHVERVATRAGGFLHFLGNAARIVVNAGEGHNDAIMIYLYMSLYLYLFDYRSCL